MFWQVYSDPNENRKIKTLYLNWQGWEYNQLKLSGNFVMGGILMNKTTISSLSFVSYDTKLSYS